MTRKAVSAKPDPTDRLEAIAERLSQYVTCIRFAQWLIENSDLPPKTDPADLAYGYAIRFSQFRPELDRIIGQTTP